MTTVRSRRRYVGPLRAAILDWAGTTVDFGSRAPAAVFREIFVREGISVTERQAREPMGRAKRDHIAAILANPEVALRWREAKGSDSTESDIDRLYERFLPLQLEVLSRHTDLIPGTVEAIAWMRQRGMKIGSTTGYTKALMEVVIPAARAGGYSPDTTVCADDVPAGRPAPWMLFEAAKRLNVFPPEAIVKVDDTPVGIEAGLNAGCWTVAVTASGNEMGLSVSELEQLSTEERASRIETIREKFLRGGAHLVIDSIKDLPQAVETIESWIAAGERP